MALYMPLRFRKATLTTHVAFSVGWLGAVACFLALAIFALKDSSHASRSAYVAAEVITLFVIIPLAIASLASGIIQAAFTRWGLFKHYWIVVKLILTSFATILLFLHLKPIKLLSDASSGANLVTPKNLQVQVMADSALAVLLLICITGISIYKPWGEIKSTKESILNWRKLAVIAGTLIALAIIISHFKHSGMSKH